MIIVNAIIIENKKILTVKRNKEPYKCMYGLPGGHIEIGESKKSALIRELKEETNSEIEVILYLGKAKNNGNDVYLYKAKIASSTPFIENSEIKELKWLKIDKFIKNLRDYKVDNLENIEKIMKKS
jgi:ADP-ribose pyrophosphatase YjhB (NUDIX family)